MLRILVIVLCLVGTARCDGSCMTPVPNLGMFGQEELETPALWSGQEEGVEECMALCCGGDLCNVAVFGDDYETDANCFLYACDPLTSCQLDPNEDQFVFINRNLAASLEEQGDNDGDDTGDDDNDDDDGDDYDDNDDDDDEDTEDDNDDQTKEDEDDSETEETDDNDGDDEEEDEEKENDHDDEDDDDEGEEEEEDDDDDDDDDEGAEDEDNDDEDENEDKSNDDDSQLDYGDNTTSQEGQEGEEDNDTENGTEYNLTSVLGQPLEINTAQNETTQNETTPNVNETAQNETAQNKTVEIETGQQENRTVPNGPPQNVTDENRPALNGPPGQNATYDGNYVITSPGIVDQPFNMTNDVIAPTTMTSLYNSTTPPSSTPSLQPSILSSSSSSSSSPPSLPTSQSPIAGSASVTPVYPTTETPFSGPPDVGLPTSDQSNGDLTNMTSPYNATLSAPSPTAGLSDVMFASVVSTLVLGSMFLLIVAVVLSKRVIESYKKRHYSRLEDDLINGIYH